MRLFTFIAAALALFGPASLSHAETLATEGKLICSVTEAVVCDPMGACERGLAEELNLPNFIRIDFAAKSVTGTRADGEEVSAPVSSASNDEASIVLQGLQGGRAWSMLVDREAGDMTLTASDFKAAFVIFGACTVP